MWDVLKVKDSPYNLRSGTSLKLPCSNTVRYGTNVLLFRGSLQTLFVEINNGCQIHPFHDLGVRQRSNKMACQARMRFLFQLEFNLFKGNFIEYFIC